MLSNTDILKELENKNIIIEPFDKRFLGTNSYDVTLGNRYWREPRTYGSENTMRNIYDSDHYSRWVPQEAERYDHKVARLRKQVKSFEDFDTDVKTQSQALSILEKMKVPDDTELIWLLPGERILGHTQEVVGGVKNITTMIKARSSVGRSGISICMCAGSGDIGYVNKWTLEITNHSYFGTWLIVGRRIGQILFFKTFSDANEEYSGKYNRTEKPWDMKDMLPRLHLDFEAIEAEKRYNEERCKKEQVLKEQSEKINNETENMQM